MAGVDFEPGAGGLAGVKLLLLLLLSVQLVRVESSPAFLSRDCKGGRLETFEDAVGEDVPTERLEDASGELGDGECGGGEDSEDGGRNGDRGDVVDVVVVVLAMVCLRLVIVLTRAGGAVSGWSVLEPAAGGVENFGRAGKNGFCGFRSVLPSVVFTRFWLGAGAGDLDGKERRDGGCPGFGVVVERVYIVI